MSVNSDKNYLFSMPMVGDEPHELKQILVEHIPHCLSKPTY